MAARIIPFGLYILFLFLDQAVRWSEQATGWPPSLGNTVRLWLYPFKTLVVVIALVWFWRQYDELRWPPRLSIRALMLTTTVGVLVYVAWVRMDWPWAMQGSSSAGYNPFTADGSSGYLLAAFRLCGATLVVPIMEELFWRSFVMRYLISSRFDRVPLGAITPFSFAAMVVLFGIEHDLWLAGMMAGVAYGLLLVRTKNLWACIGAHAITNLALGIHVLVTKEWGWW
ncbi:MAG TPA: CAAX prenyl protease-related protein [Nitrospira sp.]|nr:CAAX prenyl protease-related protein [Nitrospira sp.]